MWVHEMEKHLVVELNGDDQPAVAADWNSDGKMTSLPLWTVR